jgi:hypothetical protein
MDGWMDDNNNEQQLVCAWIHFVASLVIATSTTLFAFPMTDSYLCSFVCSQPTSWDMIWSSGTIAECIAMSTIGWPVQLAALVALMCIVFLQSPRSIVAGTDNSNSNTNQYQNQSAHRGTSGGGDGGDGRGGSTGAVQSIGISNSPYHTIAIVITGLAMLSWQLMALWAAVSLGTSSHTSMSSVAFMVVSLLLPTLIFVVVLQWLPDSTTSATQPRRSSTFSPTLVCLLTTLVLMACFGAVDVALVLAAMASSSNGASLWYYESIRAIAFLLAPSVTVICISITHGRNRHRSSSSSSLSSMYRKLPGGIARDDTEHSYQSLRTIREATVSTRLLVDDEPIDTDVECAATTTSVNNFGDRDDSAIDQLHSTIAGESLEDSSDDNEMHHHADIDDDCDDEQRDNTWDDWKRVLGVVLTQWQPLTLAIVASAVASLLQLLNNSTIGSTIGIVTNTGPDTRGRSLLAITANTTDRGSTDCNCCSGCVAPHHYRSAY